ncbi:hypothetical protein OF83DRAFT_1086646 [Amylostereum chailletii]|nr:hypothetical protein OF83DRAFT_1086646 [Amylostereum chailletii]
MAAHEIYAEVLTGRKHGYPLWNPSPTEDLRNMSPGSPKAIQLGDVGYVFRGSFHRLFNVHLPEQHDDQGKFLPEYFVPLDVSPLPLRRSTRPGPETISSTNTRVTKVSAEAGSPGFGGLHLLVKPTRKSSAALHFVEDAFFEDVPNPGEYKKYTLEHGESWYKLAKDLKLGIGPGEMMLITGRTMTNTWANIAFADTTSEFEVALQVDH